MVFVRIFLWYESNRKVLEGCPIGYMKRIKKKSKSGEKKYWEMKRRRA